MRFGLRSRGITLLALAAILSATAACSWTARQVRGTSVNQVDAATSAPVVVTAGTGVPTSGLVLQGS